MYKIQTCIWTLDRSRNTSSGSTAFKPMERLEKHLLKGDVDNRHYSMWSDSVYMCYSVILL